MTSPFGRNLAIKGKYYPEDRTAILYGDKKITWKDLYERSNSIANALLDLGVEKGDNCGFLFHNTPEFIETNFAIQKIGAVPVPLNYRYVPSELEYVVNNSDSKILIFEGDALETVRSARPNLKKVENYICSGKNDFSWILNYGDLIHRYPSSEPEVPWEIGDDDLAIICYTGGTTGRPKGVMLTYDNLVSSLFSITFSAFTILPPVEIMDKLAGKGERLRKRLLNELRGMGVLDVVRDPGMQGKVIVLETDRFDLTLSTREETAGVYRGKAEEYDLLVSIQNVKEHLRNLREEAPKSFSLLGRIKLGLNIINELLFGDLSIEGPIGTQLKFVRALRRTRRSGEEEPSGLLMCPPLFHMAGYTFLLAWLGTGNVLALPTSKKFDPEEALEIIDREDIRQVLMVPTMYHKVVQYPDKDKFDLSSVGLVTSGGSLFSGDLKKKVIELFPNALLMDGFGQTEMSPLSHAKFDIGKKWVKDRSIGKSLPGIEVKIVDEDGEEVDQGEVGELIYRGPTVMKGYYNDPEKTKESIKEGWFYSGDLAYRGEDGEIYTVERKTECITSGAEKIYPLEVEEVIDRHPDVERSCVIGVPHEKWGEAVTAVVQLKEGSDLEEGEIIDWCEGKIAGYKKPKSVLFEDSLPLTPVGKVERKKVKERYK